MQDVNIVTLVCRLAADPELRSLASGTSVANLRVAFNTSKKNAAGQWEDVGNFVNVSVFGAQGEACARNLKKGQRVAVSGRLEHRTWTSQEGQRREAHNIVANTVQYLDPKTQATSQAAPSAPAQAAPANDDDVPF